MDIKEQVKLFVESKFGKVINDDLKDKIVEENSQFDVQDYVNGLLGKYLYSNDIEKLKESLTADFYYDLLDFESENSTEERNNLHDSTEFESSEFRKFSVEKLLKNLESGSEEVIKKSLQALEASTEDLINQSSWNQIDERLRNIFIKMRNKEMQISVLKVFCKVLKWHKRPQISSRGFASVAKVIADQIDLFNLEAGNFSLEEIYDIKEKKWLEKKISGFEYLEYSSQRIRRHVNPEVMIKLMWLLIDYQHQIRINEMKYREVIFSFIHLLSSTTTTENTKLSGLELLSVLSPRASWCHSWCHTAVGRSQLCSALRKYKNFFVQIIEVVLNHVKIKKASFENDMSLNKNLPKLEHDFLKSLKINENTANLTKKEKNLQKIKYSNDTRSTITEHTRNSYTTCKRPKKPRSTTKWIIGCIPSRIVKEALFFHCISFISCLIKSQNGRALFPVQTAKSKRLLTVQAFSLSIIEYLENINYYKFSSDVGITSAYQEKALEMLNILKTVSTHMNSFRKSAKRPQFPFF